MNTLPPKIVFQEVPDHISCCFQVTGCQIKCKECHSPELWNNHNGKELSVDSYISVLKRYNTYISCILFMGGDTEENTMELFLRTAKNYGFKTCLYTGYEEINPRYIQWLDYAKTGKYIEELGGLSSRITNQKFIDLQTNNCLNYKFWSRA